MAWMPIKKSAGEIKQYAILGKQFGAILEHLRDYIETARHLRWVIDSHSICNKFTGLAARFSISPVFTGYCNAAREPFGQPVCVSVDDQVAHGKYNKALGSKDTISIDCGATNKVGLNIDAAFTTSLKEEDWVKAPLVALKRIVELQPKDTVKIASIIQDTAAEYNLRQVVSVTGHGIGHRLHEAPYIHNARGKFQPIELFNGLCFCAEPIYVKSKQPPTGSSDFITPTYIDSDGWTIRTTTGDPASHWETTFAVIDGKIVDLVGITKWT